MRALSGRTVGTPASSSGAAAIGPTQPTTTRRVSSSTRAACLPVRCARSSVPAAAGALVNVRASTVPSSTPSKSRSNGPGSAGPTPRYTGISSTSAPDRRRVSTKSRCGRPCSCTAMRTPATPRSSRCRSRSAVRAESGA